MAALTAMAMAGAPTVARAANPAETTATTSPIKHVIVVIGENATFDHLYATYTPRPGQSVANLLSRGIVNADGTPGPAFVRGQQFSVASQPSYYIAAPLAAKTPYTVLPPPDLGGVATTPGDTPATQFQAASGPPPFATQTVAALAEPFLEPQFLKLLTTGASGLTVSKGPDTRILNVTNLPNGPFQITAKNAAGQGLAFDSYTEDTWHRFYQMWQQYDCDMSHATRQNPGGCLGDLLPFVVTTFNGSTEGGQGTSMAFYNMQQGDAPFLKSLADGYTLADNYHQGVMGGTGINHIMMQTGDMYYFSNGLGAPAAPPSYPPAVAGLPSSFGAISSVANPNPIPGTVNQYRGDLAGVFGLFTNCSDPSQPGVAPILNYLASLPYHPASNCAANTSYLINNIFPAFHPNGTLANPASTTPAADGSDYVFIPPQTVPTIGDGLNAKNVSWAFYSDGFNHALANDAFAAAYCPICNVMQSSPSIMGTAASRAAHLKDSVDFITDVANGNLPAVSYVKPSGFVDGHPQSSKVDLFEAFLHTVVDTVNAQPALAAETAILVTWDEGGGFFDSGFIQTVDFFGDGPRTPFLVISPYSQGGNVVHNYYDHVSILKFIERNWGLPPLSARSRDNLRNPIHTAANPYVPTNMPAIGDLFELFNFH